MSDDKLPRDCARMPKREAQSLRSLRFDVTPFTCSNTAEQSLGPHRAQRADDSKPSSDVPGSCGHAFVHGQLCGTSFMQMLCVRGQVASQTCASRQNCQSLAWQGCVWSYLRSLLEARPGKRWHQLSREEQWMEMSILNGLKPQTGDKKAKAHLALAVDHGPQFSGL